MTAEPELTERIHRARAEFDRRTSEGKIDAQTRIFRSFMLGVLFPQLAKQAKQNPTGVRDSLAEMIGTLVQILGLTPRDLFPPEDHARWCASCATWARGAHQSAATPESAPPADDQATPPADAALPEAAPRG